MSKSVVIIGGGPGGLFAGAILSKEGIDVTLIEKNRNIGGGLQSFCRFGECFDTGMHVLGGMSENGNIMSVCKYLGIGDKLNIKKVDDSCMDKILIAEDNKTYNIASGKEGFVKSLSLYFPDEKENLKQYIDAVFNIASSIDIIHGNIYDGRFHYAEDSIISTDEFIAKYIKNEKLQRLLAYFSVYYCLVKGETPAYIHAIITSLYVSGTMRFVGGSGKVAAIFENIIRENGGKVIKGNQVEEIKTEGQEIISVKTSDGRIFSADYYISTIHPCSLLSLIDRPNVFNKSYRNRITENPNTYSAFSLYIKLKPRTIPYYNHTGFIFRSYDSIFDLFSSTTINGLLYTTPPDKKETENWSNKLIITCPMQWKEVERWEHTKTGDRGPEYSKWKKDVTEKIIDILSYRFPDIRNNIEAINSASPLTIRDYFGSKNGSLYGFRKDCRQLEQSTFTIHTKLTNLLLSGQNVNLHGLCGVMMTSVMTSEAILGNGIVIDKIKKMKK